MEGMDGSATGSVNPFLRVVVREPHWVGVTPPTVDAPSTDPRRSRLGLSVCESCDGRRVAEAASKPFVRTAERPETTGG